jgi:uncharacterized protein YbjT (DUF2867 family)
VERLRGKQYEVMAAAPSSGVNCYTGEGLAEALAGAKVLIDLANSPAFDEATAVEFFGTASRNLLAAAAQARVQHHVALSVVGTDRLGESGYLCGKMVQEKLIRESGIPYTVVRSTQFLDFLGAIAQSATEGQTVHVPMAYMQPIASDDVADAMADIALSAPANGIVEIAGPERVRFGDIIGRFLKATDDPREVVASREARYFGYLLDDLTLVPGSDARIGPTRFEDWISRFSGQHVAAQ